MTTQTRNAVPNCKTSNSKEQNQSPLHRFPAELLIGQETLKPNNDEVAVFGLGGVGGFAAERLGRAGIGRLVIVAFDDICPPYAPPYSRHGRHCRKGENPVYGQRLVSLTRGRDLSLRILLR